MLSGGKTNLNVRRKESYNFFLTAKEAVQQSIRLSCVFVSHNLEILLLRGSQANQSTL